MEEILVKYLKKLSGSILEENAGFFKELAPHTFDTYRELECENKLVIKEILTKNENYLSVLKKGILSPIETVSKRIDLTKEIIRIVTWLYAFVHEKNEICDHKKKILYVTMFNLIKILAREKICTVQIEEIEKEIRICQESDLDPSFFTYFLEEIDEEKILVGALKKDIVKFKKITQEIRQGETKIDISDALRESVTLGDDLSFFGDLFLLIKDGYVEGVDIQPALNAALRCKNYTAISWLGNLIKAKLIENEFPGKKSFKELKLIDVGRILKVGLELKLDALNKKLNLKLEKNGSFFETFLEISRVKGAIQENMKPLLKRIILHEEKNYAHKTKKEVEGVKREPYGKIAGVCYDDVKKEISEKFDNFIKDFLSNKRSEIGANRFEYFWNLAGILKLREICISSIIKKFTYSMSCPETSKGEKGEKAAKLLGLIKDSEVEKIKDLDIFLIGLNYAGLHEMIDSFSDFLLRKNGKLPVININLILRNFSRTTKRSCCNKILELSKKIPESKIDIPGILEQSFCGEGLFGALLKHIVETEESDEVLESTILKDANKIDGANEKTLKDLMKELREKLLTEKIEEKRKEKIEIIDAEIKRLTEEKEQGEVRIEKEKEEQGRNRHEILKKGSIVLKRKVAEMRQKKKSNEEIQGELRKIIENRRDRRIWVRRAEEELKILEQEVKYKRKDKEKFRLRNKNMMEVIKRKAKKEEKQLIIDRIREDEGGKFKLGRRYESHKMERKEAAPKEVITDEEINKRQEFLTRKKLLENKRIEILRKKRDIINNIEIGEFLCDIFNLSRTIKEERYRGIFNISTRSIFLEQINKGRKQKKEHRISLLHELILKYKLLQEKAITSEWKDEVLYARNLGDIIEFLFLYPIILTEEEKNNLKDKKLIGVREELSQKDYLKHIPCGYVEASDQSYKLKRKERIEKEEQLIYVTIKECREFYNFLFHTSYKDILELRVVSKNFRKIIDGYINGSNFGNFSKEENGQLSLDSIAWITILEYLLPRYFFKNSLVQKKLEEFNKEITKRSKIDEKKDGNKKKKYREPLIFAPIPRVTKNKGAEKKEGLTDNPFLGSYLTNRFLIEGQSEKMPGNRGI